MSRRINKTMAFNAAERMADKAFAEKLSEASKAVNEAIERLVLKYVPQEVIDVCNKYPQFFSMTTYVSVSAYKDTENCACRENWISGTISFTIPYSAQSLTVTSDEYVYVKKLLGIKKSVVINKENFQNEIHAALLQLNTEKKVKENLPEALKYIEFPKEKQLPACQFDDLNKVISKI